MRIKQNANCEVSINRFDNGESVNIGYLDEVDIDNETALYLLSMRVYDSAGNLLSDFIEV